MINVEKARTELATKTKQQIEAETAEVWAARAIASYDRFIGSLTSPMGLSIFAEAVDYEREAHEHAAEAGLEVLHYIKTEILRAKMAMGLP